MSWDRSQANFCLVSLSHPHCFRSNDLFSPPLFFFFFFRPPFLFDGFYYLLFDLMHRREFLISVIRLTYSEGGIYLLVCLFAFSPKFDSRIDSAFRFDMVRQSTTGSFFITKMKQKNTKTKRNGSARLTSQRTGVSWVIVSDLDLLLASNELGLAGFDFLMDGGHSFLVFLALLACLLAFLIESACFAAAVFRSGDLYFYLRHSVPTYPDPV